MEKGYKIEKFQEVGNTGKKFELTFPYLVKIAPGYIVMDNFGAIYWVNALTRYAGETHSSDPFAQMTVITVRRIKQRFWLPCRRRHSAPIKDVPGDTFQVISNPESVAGRYHSRTEEEPILANIKVQF